MAIQGNGMTVDFATSGFSADITSVSWDGETRDDIDTSHLLTADYRTFDAGVLSDGGTVTLEVHFDPTDIAGVPYRGAEEVVTITYPNSTTNATGTATVAFPAYLNSYSDTGSVNELMTATIVLKVAGTPTRTDEV